MQSSKSVSSPLGSPLQKQVIGFLFVGGFCFVLNILLLWMMVDSLGVESNLSNLITSILVTFVAYLLNRWLIFEPGRHKQGKEIIAFFILSFLGLGINVLLFYLGTTYTPIHYLVVKAVVTVLVAAFNFVTRKFLVFKG